MNEEKKNRLTEEMDRIEKALQVTNKQEQNSEKRIAQAFLDAHKMYEDSYYVPVGDGSGIGQYRLSIEYCLRIACENHKLSSNLWRLFVIANSNDFKHWAENVISEIWD